MLEFQTKGFNGYAVKYSPFVDTRIAAATSANFGLVGNGRLYIFQIAPNGIQVERCYDTQDSIYDTAWSEAHENQIVTACGDGSVKLYDLSVATYPVHSWNAHNREVYAVGWNLKSKDTFVSSSWDGTIKVWSPMRPDPIVTLPTHSCTYSSAYSPHSASVISSVSSDSHLRIFDLRTPASASNHLVSLIPIHGAAPQLGVRGPKSSPSEALTHDWNKYRDTVVATAGVDSIIRTFDIRNAKAGPVASLRGHEYAVRKLSWSPHLSDVLLSASYDMTVRVWSDGTQNQMHPGMGAAGGRELGRMGAHTEFATGVDWCMFGLEGWCASVAWDERLLIWDAREVMGQNATRFRRPW